MAIKTQAITSGIKSPRNLACVAASLALCASNADCPASHETCHATKKFCKPLLAMKNTQNHAWSDVDLDGDLDLLAGAEIQAEGAPTSCFEMTSAPPIPG